MLRKPTSKGSVCSGIFSLKIYKGVSIRRNGMRNQLLNAIPHLFLSPDLRGQHAPEYPVMYGVVKFIRKVGHYYQFELPNPIHDHADFKGTSGAPIMDTDGKLVSLVTHGYEGAKMIYGIAIADFKSGIDVMLLTDEHERKNKS